MLGGLWDTARPLLTEGAHGAFEQACERAFGAAIRAEPVGATPGVGTDLWCALANVDWAHPTHGDVGYSFRAAGDLIAALRREGMYMDWYCNGPSGHVAEHIEDALAAEGWTYEVLT